MPRVFVDTSVWVRAYEPEDAAVREQAHCVIAQLSPSDIVVSSQVLSEFLVATTMDREPPLDRAEAVRAVVAMAGLTVVPLDPALIVRGVEASALHGLSYWDGVIVAAALGSGCERILSEGFDGADTVAGLAVVNPFAAG